jgi:predicted ArsR family transcriptional regulator
MVDKLFSQVANDLVADYTSELDLDGIPFEERLDIVQDLLGGEGFTMEWDLQEDGYHIREVNCPYYHVGQNHPEVCAVDQTLISSMLNVPVEKVKCILDGDSYCTYIVPTDQNSEGTS